MLVGCISSESRSSPGSLYEPLQISVCRGFRFLALRKSAGDWCSAERAMNESGTLPPHEDRVKAIFFSLNGAACSVSVPSLPAGGKTRGGFHKTAPYELHGSVSRLTLSDNAQHNAAAAML